MRELRPNLWHWEAPHPQWRPTEPWSENVSSYAIDDGERLLLFDPLAVPSELWDLSAGRETAIVLTAPWHERDAQSLVERLAIDSSSELIALAARAFRDISLRSLAGCAS